MRERERERERERAHQRKCIEVKRTVAKVLSTPLAAIIYYRHQWIFVSITLCAKGTTTISIGKEMLFVCWLS